jgi:5-methyltetrahydrofolate--homocysteine methyltransferase
MTTTVRHMEETVKLLHEKLPGCRVVVGGAVLTQEYADMMGADFYSKDAMEMVRICREVLG